MGADTRSFVPVEVAGLGAPMTVVSSGGGHTCAAGATGVKCWGQNWQGQAGVPTTVPLVTTPSDVAGLPAAPIDVRAGDHHTCAIVAGGALWCWGGNDSGQLGNGVTSTSPTPVPAAVTGLATGVVEVAPGEFHTCAVANGGAKCWGAGSFGRLGDGTGASSTVPVGVSGLASGVASVAAGVNHSCALTTAGAVKCWGRNSDGELGNNSSGVSARARRCVRSWRRRNPHRGRLLPHVRAVDSRRRVVLGCQQLWPARQRLDDAVARTGAGDRARVRRGSDHGRRIP